MLLWINSVLQRQTIKLIWNYLSAKLISISPSCFTLIFKDSQECLKEEKHLPCGNAGRSSEVWDHVPLGPTVIKKSTTRFNSYFKLYIKSRCFVQLVYSLYKQGISTFLCAETLVAACMLFHIWKMETVNSSAFIRISVLVLCLKWSSWFDWPW